MNELLILWALGKQNYLVQGRTLFFPGKMLCFPGASDKEPPANGGDIRDVSSIPGLRRSPGGGQGNSPQYSYLENPHGQSSLAGYSP